MSFWFNGTSGMVIGKCGETGTAPIPSMLPFTLNKDNTLAVALDSGGIWAHDVNHEHYVKLDLGRPHYITQFKGMLTSNTNVKKVSFYISAYPTDFGDPVLTVDDWLDYTKSDNNDPYRYSTCTPKVGRYVLILIQSTHDANNHLRWG